MNVWGLVFVLPVLLLVILDPVKMIPVMVLAVAWIAFWLWALDKAIGPPKE